MHTVSNFIIFICNNFKYLLNLILVQFNSICKIANNLLFIVNRYFMLRNPFGRRRQYFNILMIRPPSSVQATPTPPPPILLPSPHTGTLCKSSSCNPYRCTSAILGGGPDSLPAATLKGCECESIQPTCRHRRPTAFCLCMCNELILWLRIGTHAFRNLSDQF